MKVTLDIGCGTGDRYPAHPRGDVNCDVDAPKTYIENFVRCDAHHLPFKNHVFSKVVSHHLVEHLSNLSKFKAEIKRVLQDNGKIEIVTPNIYSKSSFKDPNHIHHFNAETLAKAFRDFKVKVKGDEGLWIPLRGNVYLFKKFPFLSRFPFLCKNLKIEGP